MIVAAIVIINPEIVSIPHKLFTPREAITLEEAMLGELSPNEFSCEWLKPQLDPDSNPASGAAAAATKLRDELVFEDSKNLNLLTMPPSEWTNNNLDATNNSSGFDFHQSIANKFRPNVSTIISNTSLISSIEVQGLKLSPSKRYLLLWTTKRKQFRYTFTAKYFLYDIKRDLISILGTNSNQQSATGESDININKQQNFYEHLDASSQLLNYYDDGNQRTKFQLVDWIPSADKNKESLILIQNNDIYLLHVETNSDEDSSQLLSQSKLSPTRLTFTGRLGSVFNGVPDWLYEEEILNDIPAYQVSPKGTSLAYMSFNDSLVDIMPYTVFGSSEQIIPKTQKIRYPKAGRVNPSVSVHLIDGINKITSNFSIQLKLPTDLSSRQHYMNRIKWLSDDKLALVWLNRKQNESYVVICSRATQWNCEKNLHLESGQQGWLDMSDDLYPLDDENYLAILFKYEGDHVGSFKHLAKVKINQPNSFIYLTAGRKDVLGLNGIDKKRSTVYYTSTVENEPGQRQVFFASFNGLENVSKVGDDINNDRCLTCAHYPDECLFNTVKMSPSTNYYIFECSGPGVPRIELRSNPNNNNEQSLDDSSNNNSPKMRLPRPNSPPLKSAASSNNFHSDSISKKSPLSSMNDLTTATIVPTRNDKLDQTAILNLVNNSNNNLNLDQNLLWTIENNQALRDKLTFNKAMPLTMRLKVPIANTKYLADVLMLLPPQLGPTNTFAPFKSSSTMSAATLNLRSPRSSTPSSSQSIEQALHSHFTPNSISEYTNKLTSAQQYPMVVDVYAGPGSQRVDYRFNINFGHYLASSKRTIYVMIDGRGSGFQGTKRLYELYHKFGTVEIQDQIEVAAYLTRNYSFIDPNKVAIWGWSYGGYAAAMALAQSNARALQDIESKFGGLNVPSNSSQVAASLLMLQNNDLMKQKSYFIPSLSPPATTTDKGVFKCAASVAPVTNWIYYDTAYTERYMSSPYLNEHFDESQANDHLISIGDNNAVINNIDSRQLRQTQGQQWKQNAPGLNNEQTASKWMPLNQTTGLQLLHSSSSLMDLVIRSSLSPLVLPTASRPSTLERDKINPLDLNDRYKIASLLDQIGNIDGKRFLLIHGTADDNVHFQQSIMLMKRLIQKNIMYETRLYPDQDHSIANKADKLHLGSTLSKFFDDCFD